MEKHVNFELFLKLLLFLFLTTVLATGCGQIHTPHKSFHSRFHSENGGIFRSTSTVDVRSSVLRDLRQIYPKENVDVCFDKSKNIILEIAGALDQRQNELDDLDRAGEDGWQNINFKLTYLRTSTHKHPPAKNEWELLTEAWSEVINDYQKIKNQPVNQDWLQLEIDVKSLVDNDADRILLKQAMFITPFNIKSFLNISKKIKECVNAPSCDRLSLSFSERSDLRSVSNYYDLLKKYETNNNPPMRKIFLESLRAKLDSDLDIYTFKIRSIIHRVSQTNLRVDINPGDFASVAHDLEPMFLRVWNSGDLSLGINWTPNIQPPQVGFLLFDPTSEKRSGVDEDSLTLRLYPGTAQESLSHELGHFLGFPDHYYVTWSEEKCQYVIYNNPTDIMSDDETGSVTKDEISQLKAAYPL
jgi:hypothetical protein